MKSLNGTTNESGIDVIRKIKHQLKERNVFFHIYSIRKPSKRQCHHVSSSNANYASHADGFKEELLCPSSIFALVVTSRLQKETKNTYTPYYLQFDEECYRIHIRLPFLQSCIC